MLPENVQKPLLDVMDQTKHNTNAILHIYICYSSTQEYEDALEKSKEQSINERIELTQELLESNFYVPFFEPDILIRTSVARLSYPSTLVGGYENLKFWKIF